MQHPATVPRLGGGTMQEENREYFMNLVKRNKVEWEHEYEYWNKLNWK